MRTTVEIPEGQRRALHSLALRKGLRGFSQVIQEAISFYIQNRKELKDERIELLRMKGSWSAATTRQVKNRIQQVRKNWKS